MVGLYRTEDHRYYFNGDGPYPSVTTILRVIDKPALVTWAKRVVSEFAVQSHVNGELNRKVTLLGQAQAAKWLASLPDYQRDVAADLGTSVHTLADAAGRQEPPPDGFQLPEGTLPYLDAFRGYLDDLVTSGGQVVSSEHAVVNFAVGYGGTYDLIVALPESRDLMLVDIKTSKGVYPETRLQLAGYSWGGYICLPGDPTPREMPTIQQYGILHLRPDQYQSGWKLYPQDVTPLDWEAFLAAFTLYQWKQGKKGGA
jgi:hypothetical protein